MTARQTLYTILLITALAGAVSGHFTAQDALEPLVLHYPLELCFSFVTFLWYCRDSDMQRYVRSRWLSVAIIGISILAIPYYLVRSRPKGKKAGALLRYVGFLVLAASVTAASMALGASWPWY
jgi:membrane-associated PAP2 superfamily phosphatase